jgi:predicted RNase H-like HicB family nuclease
MIVGSDFQTESILTEQGYICDTGGSIVKISYYARFSYNDEGPDVFKIGIFFPDLPGCLSCADTREEAIEMAMDALETWFDDDEMDESEIAPPSRLDDLLAREDGASYENEISHEYVLIETEL